jgi:hypothetical protein
MRYTNVSAVRQTYWSTKIIRWACWISKGAKENTRRKTHNPSISMASWRVLKS